MTKVERSRLREANFGVRCLLFLFIPLVLCHCEGTTWTQTGWTVVGILTFVLLTHRLFNKAAQWVHDNTDYASSGP